MTIPRDIETGGSPIAVGNGQGGPSGGAGPVERISVVAAVLPCPGCAHAAVCAIRPHLDPEKLSLRTPAAPHKAIRIRMTLELECEHFLAGNFPEPAPAGPVRVSQALRDTASRQRGAAGLVKARAVKAELRQAAGEGPGKPPVQTGLKRSPEARERMRLAMVASYERRRAAQSGSGVPE
jgi:hypothetical protein